MNASKTCVASADEMFACAAPRVYDVEGYRKDFPILTQTIHGHQLVYLDNGASAQKPRMVLEAMQRFLENDYANIHRGVHELSVRSTDKFEAVRETVRRFLNAEYGDEIVFTHVGTEAFNLVASSWGRRHLKAGDEVVITTLEHHANIVPWQMLRDEKGIVIRVVPITPAGEVLLEDVQSVLSSRTKLVSVAHVSNVLGTILPVEGIIKLAHDVGALVLLDGCQAAVHMPVDVRALDADFYIFTAHKLYGPTGLGVLYGKRSILKDMPPYQGGGDMIASVSFDKTTYKDPPYRFEAGTPPITEVIGLGAAIDYVTTIGLARIRQHEDELLTYATQKLQDIKGLTIVGTAPQKAGVLSFTLKGIHPHDVGTILDRQGVAVRAGHHCAQPLMEFLGIPATARASFGLYNNRQDIDALVRAVYKTKEIFHE